MSMEEMVKKVNKVATEYAVDFALKTGEGVDGGGLEAGDEASPCLTPL